MHYKGVKLITLLLIAASLNAAEPVAVSGSDWRVAYRWSAASLLAATTADAVSTAGLQERNPLLRSRDGSLSTRGVGIKYGIAVGTLVAQHFVLRRHPERRKLAAVVNFATAAGFSVIAAHNFKVR